MDEVARRSRAFAEDSDSTDERFFNFVIDNGLRGSIDDGIVRLAEMHDHRTDTHRESFVYSILIIGAGLLPVTAYVVVAWPRVRRETRLIGLVGLMPADKARMRWESISPGAEQQLTDADADAEAPPVRDVSNSMDGKLLKIVHRLDNMH